MITLDFDATLATAHSEKQDAAATYKRGFGFHPLAVWLDETAEPLAAMLRPGNAGANNAADHVRLLGEAIDALPGHYQDGHRPGDDPAKVRFPLLVRADSAGATHDFLDAVVARNAQSSVGFAIDTRVRDAIVCSIGMVRAVEPAGCYRWTTYSPGPPSTHTIRSLKAIPAAGLAMLLSSFRQDGSCRPPSQVPSPAAPGAAGLRVSRFRRWAELHRQLRTSRCSAEGTAYVGDSFRVRLDRAAAWPCDSHLRTRRCPALSNRQES